jgi:glycosyltransferase involved in cell wall biosynthesis
MKRQTPLVSIVLPNLNYYPFLEERIRSILSQTFENLECIVIDGYSSDGSWAFFQKTAAKDPRMRLYQEPPRGIYDAWNKGIERARGEYVAIATSDDTMDARFLEKMIEALEACPSAGIAHCCLTIIDEEGKPRSAEHQWAQWKKVLFYGDWIRKYHLRRCPFDAIVHAGFSTVYSSVTQLLIRKSLFDRVGLFTDRFGTVSDFEWELRASLNTDTVHVPHYLATWRVHANRATDNAFLNTAAFFEILLRMVDSACRRNNGFAIPRNDLKRVYFARYMEKLRKEMDTGFPFQRLRMLTRAVNLCPLLTLRYIIKKVLPRVKPPVDAAETVMSILSKFPDARIDPIPEIALLEGNPLRGSLRDAAAI